MRSVPGLGEKYSAFVEARARVRIAIEALREAEIKEKEETDLSAARLAAAGQATLGQRLKFLSKNSADGELLSHLTPEEVSDLKLYMASILNAQPNEVKRGRPFALLFGDVTQTFEPTLAEDGSLRITLITVKGRKTFIYLTQSDLKSLNDLRRAGDPTKLKASLLQGMESSIKLQNMAIVDALNLNETGDAPLSIAYPMSALAGISPARLASQAKIVLADLLKHARTSYGKKLTFYFYGAPNQQILQAFQDAIKFYGSSGVQMKLGLPDQGVVLVDPSAASTALTNRHLALPIDRVPANGIGSWFGVTAEAIRAGRDALAQGPINTLKLTTSDVTAHTLDGYNMLAEHGLESRVQLARILYHSANTNDILSLMKAHLLRGHILVPVDLNALTVLEHLAREAAHAA